MNMPAVPPVTSRSSSVKPVTGSPNVAVMSNGPVAVPASPPARASVTMGARVSTRTVRRTAMRRPSVSLMPVTTTVSASSEPVGGVMR